MTGASLLQQLCAKLVFCKKQIDLKERQKGSKSVFFLEVINIGKVILNIIGIGLPIILGLIFKNKKGETIIMEKLNSIKNFATKTLEKIAALDKDNWLFEYIDKEKLSEKIAEDLTNDMKNLIKQE